MKHHPYRCDGCGDASFDVRPRRDQWLCATCVYEYDEAEALRS